MAYNYRSIDSQNRTSAVLFIIEAVEKFISETLSQGHYIKRFSQLKHHIASKTVGHYDVHFIIKHIPAFNITNKIETGIRSKQRIGGLGQHITLFFFLSNV